MCHVSADALQLAPILLYKRVMTRELLDWTESRFLTKHGLQGCLALDTCDGRHLEVGWRSHASCQLLCKINADTHTGPPCHSWGIADARGQNWACDILNQSEENP
ncbi:unnamed protein product [Pleuronectes platessa]|uniref:Uncharacterized protein n=1 Tax=Pleuronectes platessa TaxID=8262 RepID=A0A9N7YUH3_PLEPL|nr:unnamed protein product [Pleuronectes platessa]